MVLGGWGSVRLNGWCWEVGISQTERMVLGGWDQSDGTDGPGRLGISQTERMVLGGWDQSDGTDGPGRLGISQTERMVLGGWGSVSHLSPAEIRPLVKVMVSHLKVGRRGKFFLAYQN